MAPATVITSISLPAGRLALSEGLWLELIQGRGPVAPWTAGFDTFDDYDQWRRR